MKFAAVTSTAALVLSLALAGPGMAQTYTIDGQVVPEDDVPFVQARCDDLLQASKDLESPSAGTNEDVAADEEVAETDSEQQEEGNVSESAQALTMGIDLELLTLEQCREGGFLADE